MHSYVNNVTATNKNNKVTICLGKKTRESYNTTFLDPSTTVYTFIQKTAVAELTQR